MAGNRVSFCTPTGFKLLVLCLSGCLGYTYATMHTCRYRGNPGSCERLGISSGVKLGLTWGPQQPHGTRPRSPALAAGLNESPLIGSLKGWPRCTDPTPTWAVLGGHCPGPSLACPIGALTKEFHRIALPPPSYCCEGSLQSFPFWNFMVFQKTG